MDIQVRWPVFDEGVVIHMLSPHAPHICTLLSRHLPFVCLQMHGLTAGNMLMSQAPIRTFKNENTQTLSKMAVGDCFFGGVSHLGMVYGVVTEPEVHSVWGRVDETDRATLARVGDAVWENLMRPWSQRIGDFTRQRVFVEFSAMED